MLSTVLVSPAWVAIVLRDRSSFSGFWRRSIRAAVVLVATWLQCALANASDLPSPFLSGTFETWSGGDGTRQSWSSYMGFSWAPLGKLSEDGLRFRAAGGYGEYRYGGVAEGTLQSIYGTAAFADLLVGYQMGLGRLTLKAFAGVNFDAHLLVPFDEANKLNTPASGAKLILEAWYNATDQIWTQADLSFASAHGSYGGRMRLGYRVYERYMQDLSIGVEAGAFGNDAGDHARAGGFVRYAWYTGEISASAGVSGDVAGVKSVRLQAPYATLVYLKRF